ncbi:hypothetical protein TNIN_477851 [Trichonephila inaurata madagascariensis]|uniref:Mos1 transposase HTH domain-containing protein n=1 Tax=Trichonephila inaurata madagascariensis TaxID=2747483 RepID=A0A8X6XHA6_9ARAC|nr:hypothetical protein TNIN_477851 [Trichonephila inaurata madagascariensis]
MVTIYGEDCVSDKSVKKWSAHFHGGCESLVDDPRLDQANAVITTNLIDKRDNLVRSDRRVTLLILAVKVYVSVGTVLTIVHNWLRYRKMCMQGVLKQLTDHQKELRMELFISIFVSVS